MSAYAALREGSIFQDEEVVIKYENSSEDESESPVFNGSPETNPPHVISTFTRNDDNMILGQDQVVFGLKHNESIAVSGQMKMVVERGAILLNGFHYFRAPQELVIIQPNNSSIPTISSIQVRKTEEVQDIRTEYNEHLFCSDYKSVVRLENNYTGLENIGKYYQPFKNLFSLPDDREDINLTDYSFDVTTTNREALSFDKTLFTEIDDIVSGLEEPSSFITIGNKNSGKSTISKLFLNRLVDESPVTILDLDPGQSEYSKPYCLSLTNHSEPIIGFNYHENEDDLHYFYGFTNPQGNPSVYMRIVTLLIQYYEQNLKPRGNHLVINTPGWIKGYGKELLSEVTSMVNPNYLILLSANLGNEEILSELTFRNLKIWKGYFVQPRYSAAEIRNFHKLVCFHKISPSRYDFITHMLEKLPFKLSYQNGDDDSFVGVNAVSILNYDVGLNFDIEDLVMMLEVSVVGVYLIDIEYYLSTKDSIKLHEHSIPYLNSSDYLDYVEYNSNSVKFMGSAMIHSINPIDKYMNLYFSNADNLDYLKVSMLKGHKLLLVKGESEVPKCEILYKPLLEDYKKRYKRSFRAKEQLPSIPYVSYNNKLNGVWKIRRNVSRRGQQ